QPPQLTPKTSFGSFALCYPPRLEGFWRNSNAAGQRSKVDYPWGSRERLNEPRLLFVLTDDLKNAYFPLKAYAYDDINRAGVNSYTWLSDDLGRKSDPEGADIQDRDNYTPLRASRTIQLARRPNTRALNANMVSGRRGIRGAAAVDWPSRCRVIQRRSGCSRCEHCYQSIEIPSDHVVPWNGRHGGDCCMA